MMFDKSRSAGALVSDIARLHAAEQQRALAPLGLSRAQFVVLCELWLADGMTQRELANGLGLEQATMANTLARMQRDGLVTRKPHPDDGRSQQIWLTEWARDLRDPASRAALEADGLLAAALPSAERELFLSMLSRVTANLRSGKTG
ncbi:DNA-binding MarR family transcriptional regulator [Hoeflea halophila]|uniref:DNA-binding MarR family transcriptional regulator n=1 Tax=Hoeflea halophila TaxID=714899 RepID=A0A286IFH2_9HYPH|nr:MarR family transcriptional regulator [Hoeflea halophila]SOE18777.1 DNA-binding MarR family transcriptional regulator [Hoeflea halophila]